MRLQVDCIQPKTIWECASTGATKLLREKLRGKLQTTVGTEGEENVLNDGDERGRALLHYASRGPFTQSRVHDYVVCVRFLLKAGASVDVYDDLGMNPLHFACDSGWLEIAELLLDAGADIHAHVGQRQAASIAGTREHWQIEQTVQKATPLLLACRAGCARLVQMLLQRGSHAYEETPDGRGPLHFVAEKETRRAKPMRSAFNDETISKAACIPLLIAAGGVSPTDKDNNDVTPLHRAVQNVLPEVVRMLLDCTKDKGVAVNQLLPPMGGADGDRKETALLMALCNTDTIQTPGHSALIVRTLLECGADLLLECHRKCLDMARERLTRTGDSESLAFVELLQGPTEAARKVLQEEKAAVVQQRREQRALAQAAEAAEREEQARQLAEQQAAKEARRASEAALIEEKLQAVRAEVAAKVMKERAKAEAAIEAQQKRAAIAEAANRAKQRDALKARRAEEAAAAAEQEEYARKKEAEAEAKRKAKFRELSDAKKAAKQEKRARRKAPSAFALQEEEQRQAAAEQEAEQQKAAVLAAEQAAAEERNWEARARRRMEPEVAECEMQAYMTSGERSVTTPPDTVSSALEALTLDRTESPRAASSDLAASSSMATPAEVGAMGIVAESSVAAVPTVAADADTCVVCLENPRTHLVFPCGHLCLCQGCVPRVTPTEACPMCRAAIVGICAVFK